MTRLTHLDESGAARMVDVGSKPSTARRAVVEGRIRMQPETLALIGSGAATKGDVLAVARIAGIMAAKRTGELIPLCHPLMLTRVEVLLVAEPAPPAIRCVSTVETTDRTGVEMEALVATQVALATVYDMCKAVDRGMTITDVALVEKSGGRSGTWTREAGTPT